MNNIHSPTFLWWFILPLSILLGSCGEKAENQNHDQAGVLDAVLADAPNEIPEDTKLGSEEALEGIDPDVRLLLEQTQFVMFPSRNVQYFRSSIQRWREFWWCYFADSWWAWCDDCWQWHRVCWCSQCKQWQLDYIAGLIHAGFVRSNFWIDVEDMIRDDLIQEELWRSDYMHWVNL